MLSIRKLAEALRRQDRLRENTHCAAGSLVKTVGYAMAYPVLPEVA